MAEEYKRPGWYPDPEGAPGERWWNGSGWSDSRRGGTPAAAASVYLAPAAPQPAAPLQPAPPVVYSAQNPAPQRPDPYAVHYPTQARAGFPTTINVSVNRNAMIGFITGLISLFAVAFLAPVAIVFSLLGVARARALKAQGATSTLMSLAIVGLLTGCVAALIAIIGLITFITAINFSVSS